MIYDLSNISEMINVFPFSVRSSQALPQASLLRRLRYPLQGGAQSLS